MVSWSAFFIAPRTLPEWLGSLIEDVQIAFIDEDAVPLAPRHLFEHSEIHHVTKGFATVGAGVQPVELVQHLQEVFYRPADPIRCPDQDNVELAAADISHQGIASPGRLPSPH
jgi:hypothetical protein